MKGSATRVYIAIGATDMRKSINGLSLLVADHFELDLFSGSYFAFCNRRRDVVKILYWAENGFCLWMKRLEADVFRWPDSQEQVVERADTSTLEATTAGEHDVALPSRNDPRSY